LNLNISNRKGTLFSSIPRSIERDFSSIIFLWRLFTFAGWLSQIKAISDSVCITDNSVFFHLAFSEQAKAELFAFVCFCNQDLGRKYMKTEKKSEQSLPVHTLTESYAKHIGGSV